MKVILFKVGKEPELTTVNGSLRNIQDIVGGNIEMLVLHKEGSRNTFALICNDEGKINNLHPNREVYTGGYKRSVASDAIYGDFFVCGSENYDFVSIEEDDLEKIMEFIGEKLEIYKNKEQLCECRKCELKSNCNYKDKYQRLPRTAPGALGLCMKL